MFSEFENEPENVIEPYYKSELISTGEYSKDKYNEEPNRVFEREFTQTIEFNSHYPNLLEK